MASGVKKGKEREKNGHGAEAKAIQLSTSRTGGRKSQTRTTAIAVKKKDGKTGGSVAGKSQMEPRHPPGPVAEWSR